MRYLLLGANGFLGTQVRTAIERTDRAPYLVSVSGRHAPLRSTSPMNHWRQIDLVRASIEEFALLLDYSKPDVIINCVGCTAGTVHQLEAVNVSVVRKLLEALARTEPVPLIHMGSSAEYGCQPEGIAISEGAIARPVGDYGRTKLVATDLITDRVERGDVRASVFRVFNPIGPGAPANSLAGTAVREIRAALQSRSTFVTLGQLSSCRDFLAAADVASAAMRVAHCVDDVPSVLNVGRGVAMSCRSMVELLADAAGFDGDVFESASGSPRSGPVSWQQADIALLRRHLHWVPTTSIAEAVTDLWQSGA
jgi:nucleoside-diphosphate-sugar epimerase